MPYLLEICCDHLGSALAAQAGGANRIELCSALSTDGLSPNAGLLASVKKHLDIPVFALIRPRAGRFVYNALELESMLIDIHHCKAQGADGIVSGALLDDDRIDVEATAQLVAASRPLPFTFHKAFDLTPDPIAALEQLMELGVDRVLTSGQASTAVEGKLVLQALVNRGGGKVEILCAGGVRAHNLSELLGIEGLSEFHSAALIKNVESGLWTVDEMAVKKMADLLKKAF